MSADWLGFTKDAGKVCGAQQVLASRSALALPGALRRTGALAVPGNDISSAHLKETPFSPFKVKKALFFVVRAVDSLISGSLSKLAVAALSSAAGPESPSPVCPRAARRSCVPASTLCVMTQGRGPHTVR